MGIQFPEICRSCPADEFLLEEINKLHDKLRARDAEIKALHDRLTSIDSSVDMLWKSVNAIDVA